MGICEVLIPLTDSPSSEVQGNSAAALGNLSSKGMYYIRSLTDDHPTDIRPGDGRTTTDDYSAFNDVWDKPSGGMHRYLHHFLTSPDATFQHIAVWTIVQLLESGGEYFLFDDWPSADIFVDPQLISNIRSSNLLIPNIRQLAETRTSTPASSIGGTPHSHHSVSHSYTDTETGEGQGEIQVLARRILDITEADSDGAMTPSAAASQMQPGSLHEGSVRDHEDLRKSLREAFSGSGH